MATRIYDHWYSAHPDQEKCATNVEYVLKSCDEYVVNKFDAGGDTMAGPLTAPSFNATSTKEAKQNIKPFEESAMKIINQVKIVSFVYKDDVTEEPQVGFIAEDTDELLSGKDHQVMKVNVTLGLLLKAVQELTEQNRELTAEVEQLKREGKLD